MRWFFSSVMGSLFGLSVSPGHLSAAGFETVILKDGQRVIGEVVAEKPTALYIDLGYDLLRVPREQVLRRSEGRRCRFERCRRARGVELHASGFYSSGVLRPSPVKDLVGKFGEAVISIETPSSKGSGFIINDQGCAITNAHVIQGETRISAILYQNVPGGFARRTGRGCRNPGDQFVF